MFEPGVGATVADWEQEAQLSLNAARALHLRTGHPKAVYQHVGFGIECALKAKILRQHQLREWPINYRARGWGSHNLNKLLAHAGLKSSMREELDKVTDVGSAWLVLKDWNNQARYPGFVVTGQTAGEMLRAATNARTGVLQWLQL